MLFNGFEGPAPLWVCPAAAACWASRCARSRSCLSRSRRAVSRVDEAPNRPGAFLSDNLPCKVLEYGLVGNDEWGWGAAEAIAIMCEGSRRRRRSWKFARRNGPVDLFDCLSLLRIKRTCSGRFAWFGLIPMLRNVFFDRCGCTLIRFCSPRQLPSWTRLGTLANRVPWRPGANPGNIISAIVIVLHFILYYH